MDKRKQVSRIVKYDIDKLKNENIDKIYKENIELTLKLKTATFNGDPGKKWKELKETIKKDTKITNTTLERKKTLSISDSIRYVRKQ